MKCLANMCNECPAGLETGCRGLYSKEGLCDYPYIGNKKLLVGVIVASDNIKSDCSSKNSSLGD